MALKKAWVPELNTYITLDLSSDGLDSPSFAYDTNGNIIGITSGNNFDPAGFGRTSPPGLTMPAGIPMPYPRLVNGRIQSTVTPSDLIDFSLFTTTYFVDNVGGNDSNSGLTYALRFKTIRRAIQIAALNLTPARVLVKYNPWVPYDRLTGFATNGLVQTSTVPICVEALECESGIDTGPFDVLSWSKTVGYNYIWEAVRSNALWAVNPMLPDIAAGRGATPYTWVGSLAALDASEGAIYTDGTKIFAVAHGKGEVTNQNCRVFLTAKNFEWQGPANLVVRGFNFQGGNSGAFAVNGTASSIVIAENCQFAFSCSGVAGVPTAVDAVPIQGCKMFAGFNCSALHALKDGFNFHSQSVSGSTVIPAVLLSGCYGSHFGVEPNTASTSNNAFTCHDGVQAVSFGCDWRNARGVVSGHISNGTVIWSVGDRVSGSLGDIMLGGSFDSAGFGVFSGAAKMYLDMCEVKGCKYPFYSTGGSVLYKRNCVAWSSNDYSTGGTITTW